MADIVSDNLDDHLPQEPARPANQFSLRGLFWAVALVGLILAPIANFGVEATMEVGPVIVFGIILIFVVWNLNTSAFNKGLIAALVWIAGVLMFPAVGSHETPPASRCQNNMKSLSAALMNYAQEHNGRLPSAAILGTDGRPWHSWRVLILPYLGEKPRYDSYSLTEPWDGAMNRRLAAAWPIMFECSLERNQTKHSATFVLVTGPGSAWGEGKPPSPAQFQKLPLDTIVMMEVKNTGIHWMEPRDLTIDEILKLVDAGGLKSISAHGEGPIVLNAGGYVEGLLVPMDRETLRRRLTAAED